jgi:hypothetical protein
MQLTVSSVDYAPDELHGQVPFVVTLLRQIPGSDRPDYWLGSVTPPLRWVVDGAEREITHLVVSARWVGDQFVSGVRFLPLNIAYVTDATLLADARLEFAKCAYMAIGVCDVTARRADGGA